MYLNSSTIKVNTTLGTRFGTSSCFKCYRWCIAHLFSITKSCLV